MSEMFTKIGGYIASGDALVYADSATMTGNGTFSEPFGVKSTDLYVQEPLFTGISGNSAYIGWNNEAVLFKSTDASGSTAEVITLNESYNNFDKLRIYYRIDDGDAGSNEILTTNTAIDCYTLCSQAPIGAVCMYKGLRYILTNGNQISASPSASLIFWNNTTANNTTVTAKCQPYSSFRVQEIVGINRKSEA